LTFVQATLDGVPLLPGAITVTPEAFVLHRPPQRPFTLVIETLLDPTANTQLMGLYRTSTCYCTQCEAEGFRRITYFLDRPDVLSVYTLRIEADRTEAPVLLGNGNRIETGELANGRHFAIWHDPFPKPSYLFAMVAGDLGHVADRFTTRSGRDVALEIYVEHGKEGRCAYAMDALKRSMRWDEEAFGREYDLDIFMIVAVSDFNMGAMENKGLNIFNDRYVLATPETATDQDYANIEAIIAHEYFHNWTGNRITCRDWFQLSLKEGLTVFRDQEFSSDQRSRAVKRINDVRLLRNQQFSEDSGPLAHPVRPEIYHEINNFYTATVYEKGAEIVRMLKAYIGDDAFRAGMDLYFERHDGEATTIEVFLACFAQASGRDLGQFFLWYRQSGTPRLTASGEYDARAKSYMLDLRQTLGPTPGQPTKLPMVIPVRMGLVSAKGDLKPTAVNGAAFEGMLTLTKEAESFTFEGVEEAPVPSLLRGFSAPVTLNLEQSEDDLVILFQNDPDPFNRWQAAQSFATKVIL
ncbi:MAG: aminopeptidase N, partial [Allorhizobium sp.]